ncbi:MAG: hypothetical protein RLZZ458_2305 [Planctomycetota bacterium]
MSSPFTFFRRNQHVSMVAIVILSMVAFTISDMMTQDVNHFITLGVLLGGAVMAFIGISRGKWAQYGVAGAITGGVLAWIVPGFLGSNSEFYQTSSIGAFDTQRVRELYMRRMIANGFMEQAFAKAFGPGTERFAPKFSYYPTIENDAIFGELLRAEAEELGIVVTDPMVIDYISSNTGEKLSAKDFVEIRNSLQVDGRGVSEDELFAAFRAEISAQMAYMQRSPGLSASTQPPAALYDLFRRTQIRQRLNLVELDVDAFTEKIADPSEQEVQAAFSQYRERFPGQDAPGSLGFRQMNKARLAYLELSYKTVEAAVPVPTDAEIEVYYNEKKDQFYRKPTEPATVPETPATPDAPATPETPANPNAPATPESNPAPENTPPDSPQPKAPQPDAPKGDDAPATPPGTDPKPPESSTNEPEKTPGTGSECLPFDEQKSPATEAPAQPAAETPAAAAPAQAPAEGDAPAQPPTPPEVPADKPAENAPTTEPQTPVPFVIPPVEYRPLDDELKAEIREQLHEQRVREEIQKRIDNVSRELQKLERDRSSRRRAIVDADRSIEPEARAEKLKDFDAKLLENMEQVGKKSGFSFVKTPLMSARDMLTDDIVPIGTASDANAASMQPLSVYQMVFQMFPNPDDPWNDANLFSRRKAVKNQFAVEGEESHFVWWITEFSLSHIAELDDPGIRDEVVLALKRQKARDEAKKRGEALAKMLNDEAAKPEAERKPAAELLQGQTVLNTTDSKAIVVRQSRIFSWLEQDLTPQMNFMQQQPRLRISTINFADESGGEVRYAGDRFMKAVFEDLPDGQATVVPDEELGVFYVAQVTERLGDEEVLRQIFLQEGRQFGFRQGGVSDLVSATVLQPSSSAWVDALWKKYEIEQAGQAE